MIVQAKQYPIPVTTSALMSVTLQRKEAMIKEILINSKMYLGNYLSFKGLEHYHHSKQHSGIQAGAGAVAEAVHCDPQVADRESDTVPGMAFCILKSHQQ